MLKIGVPPEKNTIYTIPPSIISASLGGARIPFFHLSHTPTQLQIRVPAPAWLGQIFFGWGKQKFGGWPCFRPLTCPPTPGSQYECPAWGPTGLQRSWSRVPCIPLFFYFCLVSLFYFPGRTCMQGTLIQNCRQPSGPRGGAIVLGCPRLEGLITHTRGAHELQVGAPHRMSFGDRTKLAG